jgi:hypothetical protein
MENTPVYKILEFIKANYDKNELDILEEFIENTFPKDWDQFQGDHYEPSEPDYNGWSAGEEAERMARIQREIK